jgi:hypothetical protein
MGKKNRQITLLEMISECEAEQELIKDKENGKDEISTDEV